MYKPLKCVECSMEASLFGTPDPAVKDDPQPHILCHFDDIQFAILII